MNPDEISYKFVKRQAHPQIIERRKVLKEEMNSLEKAIAVGAAGFVNGKYFPMLEYDKVTLFEVEKECKKLQKKFNLHQAIIYRTQNGYHARFYYDNQLTKEQVYAIIKASACSKEYKEIVEKNFPINRLFGKYKQPDICLAKILGKLPLDEKQRKLGFSIWKFFRLLHNKPYLPSSLLLKNEVAPQ